MKYDAAADDALTGVFPPDLSSTGIRMGAVRPCRGVSNEGRTNRRGCVGGGGTTYEIRRAFGAIELGAMIAQTSTRLPLRVTLLL